MVDLQKFEEDFGAFVKESTGRHDATDRCLAELKDAMINSQNELKDGLIESKELYLVHLQKLEEDFRAFVKDSARHDATDRCLLELKDAMLCSHNGLKDGLIELKELILRLNLQKLEVDFRAFVKESVRRHDMTDKCLAGLKADLVSSHNELKDTLNELKEVILGVKHSSRSSPDVSGGCASEMVLCEGVLGVDQQIPNADSDVEFSTSYRQERFMEVDYTSDNDRVTTTPFIHLDGLNSPMHKAFHNTTNIGRTTTCSELVQLPASRERVVTLINGEHAVSCSYGGLKIEIQMPVRIFQAQTLREAYLERPLKQSQLPAPKPSLLPSIHCCSESYYSTNDDCLSHKGWKHHQVGILPLLKQLTVAHTTRCLEPTLCSREIVERRPTEHPLFCNNTLAPGPDCKREQSHIVEIDEEVEKLKEVDNMPSSTEVYTSPQVASHAVECSQGPQSRGVSLHSGCNHNVTEVGAAREPVHEPTAMTCSSVEVAMDNTLSCSSRFKNFDSTVRQNEIDEEVQKLEADKIPSPTEVYTISQVPSPAVECSQKLHTTDDGSYSGCNHNLTEVGAAREPVREPTALTYSSVEVAMDNTLSCSSGFKNFDPTVHQNKIDEEVEKLEEADKVPSSTEVYTISHVPTHAVECSQGLRTTVASSHSGCNHNLTEDGAAREPVCEPTAMTCSRVEVAMENMLSCSSSCKNFDPNVRQNDYCQIGGVLSKKTKPSQKKSLIDEVFSWSVDDILNGDLFVNKVKKIPESFQSMEQYYDSFIYPLLEETRAELSASLINISKAPYAEVRSIDYISKRNISNLVLEIQVDYWINEVNAHNQGPYRMSSGDVFLLTDAKPGTISDMQRSGGTLRLGYLSKIVDSNDVDYFPLTPFQVKASSDVKVDLKERSLFIVFLMNISTNKRIWNSLHVAGNSSIIKKILTSDSLVEEECCHCASRSVSFGTENNGRTLTVLNESQRKVVMDSLSKLECKHRSSVELVWGPPGTGKTETLSTMVINLLRGNSTILVCAPSATAGAEVATHVLKMMKELTAAGCAGGSQLFTLANFVLFRGEEWTKLSGKLEQIDLDCRVKRLKKFVSATGWKHSLARMIHFLREPVSEYNHVLENSEKEDKTTSCNSFLNFVRDSFQDAVLSLKRYIATLFTDIPKSFIANNTLENVVSLSKSLDAFKSLLSTYATTSERLLWLSSQPVVPWADLNESEKLLLEKKSECLKALEDVLCGHVELQLPSLESGDAIVDFCFQNASLIFCTASSAYKLRSMKMKPLGCLVVDDAAQLKECETTIPLQLNGLCHTILFGDQFQLPAVVNSRVSAKACFGRSLFERLLSLGCPKHVLNIQYRMHPSISFYPNLRFYEKQIVDAPNVMKENHENKFLPALRFGPYSFIDISCGKEEIDSNLNSPRNMVEVKIMLKIVQSFFKAWRSISSRGNISIGILSPFEAQVIAIQEKIGQRYSNDDGFSLKVKSIDGIQGGECDIILLSTVRSNSDGNVGFISNLQRTNVALTRARHCLWILGNARTLLNSQSVWKSVVQNAMDRKCFYHAEDDSELSKIVLEIKKELDQFDDLLNADSFLFKTAKWKVLFSERYRISFQKLKSQELKELHLNLLLRLSTGWRSKSIVDVASDKSSGILKRFKVKDLHTVFSVDVEKEKNWIQVLKFWDILALEDVSKMVKRFDVVVGSYTDEHLSRCKAKRLDGDLVIPMTWNFDVVQHKNSSNANIGGGSSCDNLPDVVSVEHCRVSESLRLMKFYSLSSGVVKKLLAGCDGKEAEFPFELTEQEREIIHFDRSSFVLGRSGTGKTTVLMMKLFQCEQLHHIALEGFHAVKEDISTSVSPRKENDEDLTESRRNSLRQIFIAVSSRLCVGVKQHISSLKRSACGWNSSEESATMTVDDMDETSQFSEIPDSFVDLPVALYPLVIPLNKFLFMLNGTVTQSFFERFPELRGLSQRNLSKSLAMRTFIREKEVTYDRFRSSYWPKFNTQLTKKLDPSTVFTQIISHIKGGYLAGKSNDSKLDGQSYVSLAEARVSVLGEKERERVYDIFLQYEKKRKENREFDLSDMVIHLHQQLESEGYKGDMMDFVYIDEVQDLTIREASLLKYVCRNFDEGYVFAGDTAQTIAKGVDFRFEDIRSLFYKEFVLPSRISKIHGKEEKGLIADIYQLSQNFRTHLGILKLGNSIVDLLYHFFPLSIDVLSPETSFISGDFPVLIDASSNELLSSIKGSGSHQIVGFGAEQVILVRDDSVKNDVVAHIGDQALVLTIVECKGLEFQDVLVYNFFSASSVVNEWEVLYGYMQLLNLPGADCLRCREFDNGRHIILCSELKQLYVAITRSRQRLWFFENEGYSKPIFEYWKRLGLVEGRQFDDDFLHEIQAPSSVQDWKNRGIKLYHQNNYEMARMCFEKAGELKWVKLSDASHFRLSADLIRSSDPKQFQIRLTKAAQLYEAIDKHELAAECYFELKEYERAGTIYLEMCGEPKFEEAGECFLQAGCYEKAAELYFRCSSFSKCLSACASGKLFELGLRYVQSWKDDRTKVRSVKTPKSMRIDKLRREVLESDMLQKFLERGAVFFHKLKSYETMMLFVRSFRSENQMRHLLNSLRCNDELLSLEIEWGNFSNAADIANLKGDLLLEADLLGKAGKLEEASKIILSYILMHSLWEGRGWPLKTFTTKEELFTKAKMFAKKFSNEFHDFVCMEADILGDQKLCLPSIRKYFFESLRNGSIRGQILCARRSIDLCSYLYNYKYDWRHNLVDDAKCQRQDWILEYVCVGTLMCYWNIWKQKIEQILECLESSDDEDSRGDFFLSYLGVKKQAKDDKINYLLLVPKADWLNGIDLKHEQNSETPICLTASQFFSAAHRYWSSEMFSVGMKVFEKLESLFQFSVRNQSAYCQIMLLIHITKCLRFFSESKLFDSMDSESKLERYLSHDTRCIYGSICSLDWQNRLTRDMLSLRRFKRYKDLIGEVICVRLSGAKKLTRREEIVELTALLLYAKLPMNLYKQVAEVIENTSPWKSCIEDFHKCVSEEIQVQSGDVRPVEGSFTGSLVRSFHGALRDTFYSNRVYGYISPSHFMYLLDRLLLLISSVNGYFFTVKSSLIEWLNNHHWNAEGGIIDSVDMQQSIDKAAVFVANVVEELLCHKQFTEKWLTKYNLGTHFYQLLVFRLFVFLCLLCMNTGKHYDLLLKLLSRSDISSFLPRDVWNLLRNVGGHNQADIRTEVFAEALKQGGCLLVIVEFSKPYAKPCPRDAILLDLSASTHAEISFPGKDLQRRNKSFWMTLDFLISEKDAHYLCLSDALWFKAKTSEYTSVIDTTMQHCLESLYFDKNHADMKMMDAMNNDLRQLVACLKSEREGNEREIKDLVRKLFCWREKVEPFVDNINAQAEAKDPQAEASLPGDAKKAGEEMVTSNCNAADNLGTPEAKNLTASAE